MNTNQTKLTVKYRNKKRKKKNHVFSLVSNARSIRLMNLLFSRNSYCYINRVLTRWDKLASKLSVLPLVDFFTSSPNPFQSIKITIHLFFADQHTDSYFEINNATSRQVRFSNGILIGTGMLCENMVCVHHVDQS